MPEPTIIPCSACGELVPPGAFCDHCGAPLPEVVLPCAGNDPETLPVKVAAEPSPQEPCVVQEKIARHVGDPPAPPPVDHAPVVDPDAYLHRGDGAVDPLALEVDEMAVFITGITSSFAFRLLAQHHDAIYAHDLSLTLHIHGRDPVVERRAKLPVGEWRIPFKGDDPGTRIPARVSLTYHIDGRAYRYEGDLVFDCYPPDENPGKIIENLVVKADENRSEYAATQNISVRVMENFTGHTAASLHQQMKQMNVPPAWKRVALYRCFDGDLEQVFQEALPRLESSGCPVSCMTVKSFRRRIHLFRGELITLGRHSSQDIICRLYHRDGKRDDNLSKELSKAHARLRLEASRVWLVDGGYDPEERRVRNSTLGTRLNGEEATMQVPLALPVDTSCRISLASFQIKATLYSCGAFGGRHPCPGCAGSTQPAALVLERNDNRPDIYVIVYCVVALNRIDPGFGRLHVARCRDGFALAYPRGPAMAAVWLDPEQPTCPGLPPGWTVGPYEPSDPVSKKSSSTKGTL